MTSPRVVLCCLGRIEIGTADSSTPSQEICMYNVGEKPGKGTYCCTNCDWEITLDDDDDRLPPCGNCGKGQNTKYVRC